MAPKGTYASPRPVSPVARADALECAQVVVAVAATSVARDVDGADEANSGCERGSSSASKSKKTKKKAVGSEGSVKAVSDGKLSALVLASQTQHEQELHKTQCKELFEKMMKSPEVRKLVHTMVIRYERSLTARVRFHRNIAKINQLPEWFVLQVVTSVLAEWSQDGGCISGLKSLQLKELFLYLTGLWHGCNLPARELHVPSLHLFLCLMIINGPTWMAVVAQLRLQGSISWNHNIGRYRMCDEQMNGDLKVFGAIEHRATQVKKHLPYGMKVPVRDTYGSKPTCFLASNSSSWQSVLWVGCNKIPLSKLFSDEQAGFEEMSEMPCTPKEIKVMQSMTSVDGFSVQQHIDNEIKNVAWQTAQGVGVGLANGTGDALLRQQLPSAFTAGSSPMRSAKKRRMSDDDELARISEHEEVGAGNNQAVGERPVSIDGFATPPAAFGASSPSSSRSSGIERQQPVIETPTSADVAQQIDAEIKNIFAAEAEDDAEDGAPEEDEDMGLPPNA